MTDVGYGYSLNVSIPVPREGNDKRFKLKMQRNDGFNPRSP